MTDSGRYLFHMFHKFLRWSVAAVLFLFFQYKSVPARLIARRTPSSDSAVFIPSAIFTKWGLSSQPDCILSHTRRVPSVLTTASVIAAAEIIDTFSISFLNFGWGPNSVSSQYGLRPSLCLFLNLQHISEVRGCNSHREWSERSTATVSNVISA